MMTVGEKYRHRETGTVASLAGWKVGFGVSEVTLACTENPMRHYEIAFPFKVRQDYVDVSSPGRPMYVAGRVTTDPLTLTVEQFAAEWEPATDA